eukprot:6470047-Amphidinium_carterae.2
MESPAATPMSQTRAAQATMGTGGKRLGCIDCVTSTPKLALASMEAACLSLRFDVTCQSQPVPFRKRSDKNGASTKCVEVADTLPVKQNHAGCDCVRGSLLTMLTCNKKVFPHRHQNRVEESYSVQVRNLWGRNKTASMNSSILFHIALWQRGSLTALSLKANKSLSSPVSSRAQHQRQRTTEACLHAPIHAQAEW